MEFRASANKADRKLGLKVSTLNIKGEVASASFTLDKGAWKDYTMDIDGNGVVRLRFEAESCKFLAHLQKLAASAAMAMPPCLRSIFGLLLKAPKRATRMT